jgi:hypothetical protein
LEDKAKLKPVGVSTCCVLVSQKLLQADGALKEPDVHVVYSLGKMISLALVTSKKPSLANES